MHRLAAGFPILGIIGPRQSGKTTLTQRCFPEKPYYRTLEDPDQLDLALSDSRGAIFENLVIGKFLKHQHAAGVMPSLFFWRDSSPLEVDLVVDDAGQLIPVEIKSGATLSADQFRSLEKWLPLADTKRGYLVYSGDQAQQRGNIEAVAWRELPRLLERLLGATLFQPAKRT